MFRSETAGERGFFEDTEEFEVGLFVGEKEAKPAKKVTRGKGETEGLSFYLKGLGGHKQLAREEEYELTHRARRGDVSARHALAASNLPFVVAIAKRFSNRGARLDDLVQEGNVGLMKAIEHFDPQKNVRFATYAVWWIRAYITRYLKDNRSQVRGGEAERASMVDFSLDNTVEEDSETTYLDRLEDTSPTPDSCFLRMEQNHEVVQALGRVRKRLGDLGWDILKERLTQDKPRTLEELGQRWGVSRERVRQVELKTKSFLARYLSSIYKDDELDAQKATA
ncbi:MAG: sigma-70 family RNA polymerase sigma factor [Cystobacterineae bacterium]|nr:sigma-70 family RNA polymerase sigma factor [Cystobacterineae bacterium]